MYAGIATTEIEKYNKSNYLSNVLNQNSTRIPSNTKNRKDINTFDEWYKEVKRYSMHKENDLSDHIMGILQTLYNCYYSVSEAAYWLLFQSDLAKEYDKS